MEREKKSRKVLGCEIHNKLEEESTKQVRCLFFVKDRIHVFLEGFFSLQVVLVPSVYDLKGTCCVPLVIFWSLVAGDASGRRREGK